MAVSATVVLLLPSLARNLVLLKVEWGSEYRYQFGDYMGVIWRLYRDPYGGLWESSEHNPIYFFYSLLTLSKDMSGQRHPAQSRRVRSICRSKHDRVSSRRRRPCPGQLAPLENVSCSAMYRCSIVACNVEQCTISQRKTRIAPACKDLSP